MNEWTVTVTNGTDSIEVLIFAISEVDALLKVTRSMHSLLAGDCVAYNARTKILLDGALSDLRNAIGGSKIHAIKLMRAIAPIGLREAKEAVESLPQFSQAQ